MPILVNPTSNPTTKTPVMPSVKITLLMKLFFCERFRSLPADPSPEAERFLPHVGQKIALSGTFVPQDGQNMFQPLIKQLLSDGLG